MTAARTHPVRPLSKPGSNVLVVFASCAPGLESLLAHELATIGVPQPEVTPGGVQFVSGRRPWYAALLWSGLASHVLLRVAEFRSRHFEELERKCASLPWEEFLKPGCAFDVRASCKRSKLYHHAAVEERVAGAVIARLGEEPEIPAHDDEDLPVLRVRLHEDVCTISLSPTREPLHRRGYRVESGAAPLREDLARALILASGWQPGEALLDPFCGTGTILIEAALMALQRAPARRRDFAFESLALDEPPLRETVWREARAREETRLPAPIHGSDRDPRALAQTLRNAEAADVDEQLELAEASLSECAWLQPGSERPARGALVCNPPFGLRLGPGQDLRALWQTLGQRVLQLPEAWRFAVLAEDRELAYATGLALRSGFLTEHGGRKVHAFVREEAGW